MIHFAKETGHLRPSEQQANFNERIPFILAFIPPKREGKGDYIFNNKYFNPAPFITCLKAIGCKSVFTYNFIRLKLSSALRGGTRTEEGWKMDY